MTHHDRATILDRLHVEGAFTLHLATGDTAWDPETGDTLLGGVVVHYHRGTFPGTAYRATIVAPYGREVRECPVCHLPVIVGRDSETRTIRTVHHHADLNEYNPLCAGSLADVTEEPKP